MFKAWCPVPSVQEQKSMARLEEDEHQQKQRWAQPKLIGEQVLEIALATEARGVMFSVSPSSQTYDLSDDLSDSCRAAAAATTRHA